MRYRLLLGACLLGALTFASAAPLKFDVFVKDEKVGSLLEETTGSDAEGYVNDSTLTLRHGASKLTFSETAHYDKDGVVSSKTLTVSADEHETKIKAKFADDGATVTVWSGENKEDNQIPLASKTSRLDPTNFWFKSIHPKIGDSVTYQSFDLLGMSWSDTKETYTADKKVKLGGAEITGHEFTLVSGDHTWTEIVDDKGELVEMVNGDLRFERAD